MSGFRFFGKRHARGNPWRSYRDFVRHGWTNNEAFRAASHALFKKGSKLVGQDCQRRKHGGTMWRRVEWCVVARLVDEGST